MKRLWVLLAVLVLAAGGCTPVVPDAPPAEVTPAVPGESAALSEAERQLGVRVEALRLAAAGYMLDFRYYVWDSERSRPLVDKALNPYLVHHRSGAYLGIPAPAKIGSLRQRPRSHYPDRSYFMLFANPGGLVKAGDLVDVVIGPYRFEKLVVE